jgi:hypothetical protein
MGVYIHQQHVHSATASHDWQTTSPSAPMPLSMYGSSHSGCNKQGHKNTCAITQALPTSTHYHHWQPASAIGHLVLPANQHYQAADTTSQHCQPAHTLLVVAVIRVGPLMFVKQNNRAHIRSCLVPPACCMPSLLYGACVGFGLHGRISDSST